MSEIIDFIIELIAVISGKGKNLYRVITTAPILETEARNIVIRRINEHLAKDPSTSGLKYSHLLLVKARKGVKVTVLDENYNKMIGVHFDDLIELNNEKVRIDI